MFDIHQQVFNKHGELNERKLGAYIDGLMEEFAASPEAKPLIESGEGVSWAAMMMEYGATYCGSTPAEMSLPDFNEVLFELFPRKVSTEPESAPGIVNELRAFWQFVHRQYGLANAGQILDSLDASAARRLQKELADPSHFGMAKSFFMLGKKAGFDMTTQEGLDEFMLAYNSQLLGGGLPPPDFGPPDFGPPDFDEDEGEYLPPAGPSPRARHEERRKARKRQRQARKRNRKK